MVVTCSPTQVTVEYGVLAGGFFVVSWGSAFMVEVVVGSSTVGVPGGLVAGHTYISWVPELKVVLVH